VDEPRGAVVLLYREFRVPVLTALGPAEACEPLWREALAACAGAARLFAVCRPEHREFVDRVSPFTHLDAMYRMRLPVEAPLPDAEAAGAACRRLVPADLPAVELMFASAENEDEEPDFFAGSMLARGVYHGVWSGDTLDAIAGTHVLAPESGVAAIGNVFTRPPARGKGLARATTAAVARELRAGGIATIVLNVRRSNGPAISVYRRLGFDVHGEFDEGLARLPD
jgi:ribosomal protein S18 acetylase RimI-like enzyme